MRHFRGARTAAVALILAVVAAVGATLAVPATAAPPVARDDRKSLYAGEGRLMDVLRNDSDPDGDDLAVCRVQEAPDGADYFVFIEDDKLFVFAAGNRERDLVITYYACDFETLAPATLTVSVRATYPMRVRKLARPGLLRVTNDNDRTVRFLYGSFRNERPDGRTRVFPSDSVVIRVHRRKIDWVAWFARSGSLLGTGHVRGIKLPARGTSPERAKLTLSRTEAKLWTEQR